MRIDGFDRVGMVLALASSMLRAEPHVTGYERFYSKVPSVAGGAVLYSELGCANCHGESPVATPRKGPVLSDLKQRVNHDWLLSFLREPESVRRGSTMPQMAHGLSDEEVEVVAAFLGSEGKGIRFNNGRHANAERGSALYHEKGCVACHAPSSDFRSPNGGANPGPSFSVIFPDLKRKTSYIKKLKHK